MRCFPALAILKLFVRSLDDDKVIGETEGYMSDERELVKRYYYLTVFYESADSDKIYVTFAPQVLKKSLLK